MLHPALVCTRPSTMCAPAVHAPPIEPKPSGLWFALGMLFLVLDQAFWGLPMPFVALFIWATSRAVLALTGYEVPLWLVTPWDTLCCMYLRGHGVRILDADTGASTGAADGLAIPGITSFRGVLLMNHRSWGDFVVDPYQGHCAVVARFAAVAVTCFAGVLGRLCSRVIMIERGKTSRAQLLDMCRSHDRYLIFPEGTRRAGTPGSDLPVALAGVGGLKNIWESRRDALVVITANKAGPRGSSAPPRREEGGRRLRLVAVGAHCQRAARARLVQHHPLPRPRRRAGTPEPQRAEGERFEERLEEEAWVCGVGAAVRARDV